MSARGRSHSLNGISTCARDLRFQTSGACSLAVLHTVCDDSISNPTIDFWWNHSLLQQVQLGAVGAEAHDPPRPTRGHSGHAHQLRYAGAIDVHQVIRPGRAAYNSARKRDEDKGRCQSSYEESPAHDAILRLVPAGWPAHTHNKIHNQGFDKPAGLA